MKKVLLKAHKTSIKRRKSRSIFIGTLVAVLIAITPYLFYSYEYFPRGAVMDTWLFTYESKYQESVSLAMWIYLGKLIPLLLLVLWFFTCKHWWYHILLIPIAMYAFQLFSLFVEDTAFFDETEIYWLLPIMMVVIPFVYFIRVKLFDKHVLGIDLEEMENELNNYRQNSPEPSQNSEKEEEEEGEEEEETSSLDGQIGYQTFSESINAKLSTDNIERKFRNFQNVLKGWLNLKF